MRAATEYHLGNLKAKLAKYRAQLLEPEKKSAKGEGFDVLKSGGKSNCEIGVRSALIKAARCESMSDRFSFGWKVYVVVEDDENGV